MEFYQQNKLKQIQAQKRNIPVDQIIAVGGQSPVGQGIDTFGKVLGSTLTKRAELRRQGEQLAQVAALTGQETPMNNTLTPEEYISAVKAKSELDKNSLDRAVALKSLKTGAVKPTISLWQDPSSGQVSPSAKEGWLQRDLPADKATSLLATSYNQNENRERPTSSTRSSAEFATTILPHIDTMRSLINEADQQGYIGPASGRIYNQFLAGKVGTTGDPNADNLLGKLRTYDSLLKTGAMRVHFGARGGQQMYDHFSEILNSGKQTASMLNGELDGIEEFMQGYKDAGKLSPLDTPKPKGILSPTAQKLLSKHK